MKLENGFSNLPDDDGRPLSNNKKCVSMTPIHYPIRNMLAMNNDPIKSNQYGNKKTAKVKVSKSSSGVYIVNNAVKSPQNGGRSCTCDTKQCTLIHRSSFKFWPKRTKYVCFVEQFKRVPDYSDFPDFVTGTEKRVIVEEEEIFVDLNNNNVEGVDSSFLFPDCFSDNVGSVSGGDEDDDEEKGIVLFLNVKSARIFLLHFLGFSTFLKNFESYIVLILDISYILGGVQLHASFSGLFLFFLTPT